MSKTDSFFSLDEIDVVINSPTGRKHIKASPTKPIPIVCPDELLPNLLNIIKAYISIELERDAIKVGFNLSK